MFFTPPLRKKNALAWINSPFTMWQTMPICSQVIGGRKERLFQMTERLPKLPMQCERCTWMGEGKNIFLSTGDTNVFTLRRSEKKGNRKEGGMERDSDPLVGVTLTVLFHSSFKRLQWIWFFSTSIFQVHQSHRLVASTLLCLCHCAHTPKIRLPDPAQQYLK